tara:strand:+ start:296 stop:463 length:168 start_codon:yes stop_codon:yes gene_type:complete
MEIQNRIKWWLLLKIRGRKAATSFAIEMQLEYLKKYDRKKEKSWQYWNDRCMKPW